MKLPDLGSLLHKKRVQKERLLSLVVGVDHILAAVWSVDEHGRPDIEAVDHQPIKSDSWDDRILAADEAIGELDEKLSQVVHKVVLGLPASYLTETGDILASVRPYIKKLTSELELSAIGFVSLPQAIIHKLKREEGVPPSVILIGVEARGMIVSLYKVGILKGQIFTQGQDAQRLEEALKSFKEAEVLPSRMLLYGGSPKDIEEVRQMLLKHPWPTRVNFLHFPKVEQLSVDTPIISVCLAGASELATSIGEEPEEATTPEAAAVSETVVAQEQITPEEPRESSHPIREEANVVMVDPTTLGFSSKPAGPITRPVRVGQQTTIEELEEKIEEQEEEETEKPGHRFTLPFLALPTFSLPTPRLPSVTTKLPIIAIVIALALAGFMAFWSLPHATVTLLQAPQTLTAAAAITVDPGATSVDPQSKTIPGTKLEHTVSGEKTLPVTGKKQVGDPAKGAVIVYNLSSASKTFKAGSVLGASTIQFKLDSDVSIASASRDANFVTTPGRANAAVTATLIGPQGNLASGTQLTFKDLTSDEAIARNDQPFSGGTSRDVTVVSRGDYDALIKSLTDELVQKAKTEIMGGVTGSERLVDATIKATPTEKTFSEEIGQEATSVNGKLTMKVTGVSYKDEDILGLLQDDLTAKVPTGFALSPERSKVIVDKAQVKKDGSIILTVTVQALALPQINTAQIQNTLAGRSVQSAQDYLRSVSGVGGVEFSLKGNIFKDKLPVNSKNILVKLSIPD